MLWRTWILVVALLLCGCSPSAVQPNSTTPAANEMHSMTPEQLFNAKEHCYQIGYKFYIQETAGMRSAKTRIEAPRFAYNEKLNTCLCEFGFVDLPSSGDPKGPSYT